jgi:hypothetical protein
LFLSDVEPFAQPEFADRARGLYNDHPLSPAMSGD